MKKALIEITSNREYYLNLPDGNKVRCSFEIDLDLNIKISFKGKDLNSRASLYSVEVPETYELLINYIPAQESYTL